MDYVFGVFNCLNQTLKDKLLGPLFDVGTLPSKEKFKFENQVSISIEYEILRYEVPKEYYEGASEINLNTCKDSALILGYHEAWRKR